jgi:hypothetical protein
MEEALIALGLVGVVVPTILWWMDRRAGQHKEQQALKVTLGEHSEWSPSVGSSHSLTGWRIDVCNNSGLPVLVQSLTYVWDDHWEYLLERGQRERFTQEAVHLIDPYFLKDNEVWSHTRDTDSAVNPDGTRGGSPSFAILTFSDQNKVVWERRSDTGELRRQQRQIHRWQKTFQWVARRLPWLNAVVLRPLAKRAIESAHQRGPARLPFSLRAFRWLWGYWGAGERDP